MAYESVPATAAGGGGGEGGATDHGALTGLGDNDHPQYRLTTAGALTPGAASGNDRRLIITGTGVTTDDTVANVRTVTVTGGGSPGAPGADGKTILSGSAAPTTEGVDGDFYIRTSNWTIYGPKASGWGSATSLVGPQGTAGTNGTNGTNGAAGADGKTWHAGSGSPSAGLGVNGDFYLDYDGHTYYGPKTAGAWGSAVSLVGPTGSTGSAGSNGTNGNTILSGTSAPTGGVNGDFYLKDPTTAPVLYGPKASGSWPGSGISLVGPAGGGGGSVIATKTLGANGPISFVSGDGVDGNTHKRYRIIVHGATQNGWGGIRMRINSTACAHNGDGPLFGHGTFGCGAFVDMNAATGFRRGGVSTAWRSTSATTVEQMMCSFQYNDTSTNVTAIMLHFWDFGDDLTAGFATGTVAYLLAI